MSYIYYFQGHSAPNCSFPNHIQAKFTSTLVSHNFGQTLFIDVNDLTRPENINITILILKFSMGDAWSQPHYKVLDYLDTNVAEAKNRCPQGAT